jgi:signal transduction histidine kinase
VQLILRYHKKWSEEKLQEYFTKVEDITDQLTKLIEQVLTISRAEREILKYNPVKVKIKEQFEGIIYKVRPKLKSKQTIKYNNNCQREEYLLDPSLIEHVVSNLISNAIKFSPEESKIEVMTEEIGKEIKITVKDEGMGIPKEEIKFIFEPFYRTSNSQNIPGTGLGLNIVKRCIELMDGKIEVESEINKGTTFIITIPIKDESDEKNIDN